MLKLITKLLTICEIKVFFQDLIKLLHLSCQRLACNIHTDSNRCDRIPNLTYPHSEK